MRVETWLKLVLAGAVAAGCASGFKNLYPGMTGPQVVAAVGRGPERTELLAPDYTAWYYDADHCVLMRSGVLVDKQQTVTTDQVETFLGGYTRTVKAQCLPPNVQRSPTVEKTVDTVLGRVKTHEKPDLK